MVVLYDIYLPIYTVIYAKGFSLINPAAMANYAYFFIDALFSVHSEPYIMAIMIPTQSQ